MCLQILEHKTYSNRNIDNQVCQKYVYGKIEAHKHTQREKAKEEESHNGDMTADYYAVGTI